MLNNIYLFQNLQIFGFIFAQILDEGWKYLLLSEKLQILMNDQYQLQINHHIYMDNSYWDLLSQFLEQKPYKIDNTKFEQIQLILQNSILYEITEKQCVFVLNNGQTVIMQRFIFNQLFQKIDPQFKIQDGILLIASNSQCIPEISQSYYKFNSLIVPHVYKSKEKQISIMNKQLKQYIKITSQFLYIAAVQPPQRDLQFAYVVDEQLNIHQVRIYLNQNDEGIIPDNIYYFEYIYLEFKNQYTNIIIKKQYEMIKDNQLLSKDQTNTFEKKQQLYLLLQKLEKIRQVYFQVNKFSLHANKILNVYQNEEKVNIFQLDDKEVPIQKCTRNLTCYVQFPCFVQQKQNQDQKIFILGKGIDIYMKQLYLDQNYKHLNIFKNEHYDIVLKKDKYHQVITDNIQQQVNIQLRIRKQNKIIKIILPEYKNYYIFTSMIDKQTQIFVIDTQKLDNYVSYLLQCQILQQNYEYIFRFQIYAYYQMKIFNNENDSEQFAINIIRDIQQ